MNEARIDLSVLIIFFTRQDTLQQVFDRVREARPARLFLYQDGPREGRPDDAENIRKCRDIVSRVDWECEVHTLFQDRNYGADESGYLADTWAFSQTDKCLVLEDDVVPELSFFSFCKEMLDRYEHDERVMLISAQNMEEMTSGIESDYFFSYTTFTWGWASWARVVNQWDADHSWLQDPEKAQRVDEHIRTHHLHSKWPALLRQRAQDPVKHFETILMACQFLHGGLSIVPVRNAAINNGLSNNSAHYTDGLHLMARGDRNLFSMKSYAMDMAHLRHPQEVANYEPYRVNAYRIRAWNHPWVRFFRILESTCYQLLYGNRKKALRALCLRAYNFITRHHT